MNLKRSKIHTSTKITLVLLFLGLYSMAFGQSFATSSTYNPKDFLQNTSIYGHIDQSIDPTVNIRFVKNNISNKQEILKLPVLSNGEYGVDFHLRETAVLEFSYFGKSIKIYLEPGDNLELNFSGENFPKQIDFGGRGNMKNKYYVDFQNAFEKYTDDFMRYKIGLLDPMDFNAYMSTLRNDQLVFLQNYDLAVKRKFTPDFKQYIGNENMYWWALQLLNYRLEKPLIVGGSVPMELPQSYYSFLKEVPISNKDALKNKTYVDFLEEFLQYKSEIKSQEPDAPFTQIELNIGKTFIAKEDGAESNLPLGSLINVLSEHETIPVAYKNISHAHLSLEDMMYIGLPDGTKGWVSKLGLEETDNDKIEKYAIARFHNLHLIKDPLEEAVEVGKLGKGEELTYLHLKTSENHMYTHHGVPYWDLLCKVKKSNGIEGWVSESTLEFRERKITKLNDSGNFLYSLTDASESRKYLEGEPLFYTLAKALFWKMQLDDLPSLAREIAVYDENNPVDLYNKILRAEYDVAQLKKKANSNYVENYAYSNLMNPTIKGVVVPLPFDNGQIYVSNDLSKKSSSIKKYVDVPVQNSKAAASKTKIKGIIKNGNTPLSLNIMYDAISYKEESFALNKKSNSFDVEVELSYPAYAYINYNNLIYEFYISPGDDVNLEIDLQNFEHGNLCLGSRNQMHALLQMQKVFLESYESELKYAERKRNYQAYAKLIEDYKKRSNSKIDKYLRRNPMPIEDIEYVRANLIFECALKLFYFIDKNQIKIENRYDFLKEINLSKQGMLNNQNYVNFLDSYFNYLIDQPEHLGSSKFELADQYLEGESKTFIQAKELAIQCKIGKAYETGDDIKEFLSASTSSQINHSLSIIYNETKELNPGALAPDFLLTDIEGNEIELADYKGKVIFIDFWATWCRPCLKALHYSQEMKSFYQNKDLVFLYVSMDENPSMWSSYVKNNNLKGLHVNVKNTNGFSSDMAKLYKVRKIPAFVLIDKEGKIAYSKAAMPGSKQLYSQINALLKLPKF